MPAIVVKDYNWRQTDEAIIIHVPFVGHPKKISLLVIDNYMKASYPPFILELFLYADVDEERSECAITDEEAIFSLRKAQLGLHWPSLETQDLDKEIKREYRNRALERSQKIAEDRAKAKSEKRQNLQREAVRAQIDLDTNTINIIEAKRDAHRMEAMREFEDWRSKAEIPILAAVPGELQENRKAIKPASKCSSETSKSRPLSEEKIRHDGREDLEKRSSESPADEIASREAKKSQHESEDATGRFEVDSRLEETRRRRARPGQDYVEGILTGRRVAARGIFEEPTGSVPLPRKPGAIGVTFTARAFPTPARESSHLQEQEWLQKQAEARRQTGFVAEDLRPEERDPQWLKDKGDEFFKAGNYLGAISAYSHGIKLSEKMTSLYVNRSAAHYALGNYFRCIDDCTKDEENFDARNFPSCEFDANTEDKISAFQALELMTPLCEGNRASRARCHARRGAALCKLSSPQHGLPELEEASRLDPGNESVARDLRVAKRYFRVEE